jgi:ABC-2 type transport system permease protein
MNKVWLVFKNEFITVVSRKSFLLTLFLFPIISFVIMLIVGGIQKSSGTDTGSMITELLMPSAKVTLEGFVDRSGLVKEIPDVYAYRLTGFDSEEAARHALTDGDISAYYLIEPDYLENGTIIYVRPDFNPLGGSVQSSSIETLMAYNLTDGNLELYQRLENPLILTTRSIDMEGPERDSENPLTFILPYGVTFLFYIVIMTASSLLLSSISNEKQTRVMEVLMTSIHPREMLTGKIVALGLTGLLQTVVWSGSGLLLLRLAGQRFALGDAFQLPVSILIWGILFFIFGYAVYASLLAGVGALVPNMREASQLTTMVIIPMIVPLMFISSLIQAPNSSMSVIFSIFPLTAPVAMMTRLAATQVPFWQSALALGLLALTAVYFVFAVAKLFRAQNLLSGRQVNVFTYLKILFGKASE